MNIIPLKQPDDSACGPTCIQMALAYFGMPHSFRDIAARIGYNPDEGMTNAQLVAALRLFELSVAEKNEVSWEELVRSCSPDNILVVSWMKEGYKGHFSLVQAVGNESITLVDPDEGRAVVLEKIHFLRLWMDYDEQWYPLKNTDIQLRWMAVVSRPETQGT